MAVIPVELKTDPKYLYPETINVKGGDTILFRSSSTNHFFVHIPDASNYFEDLAPGSNIMYYVPPRGLAETPQVKGSLDETVEYGVYKADTSGGVIPSDAPPRIIIGS